MDKPGALASLSEVERRSWVHVERVDTATGEVVRIEGWVFPETGSPIEKVRAVTPLETQSAVFPIPRPDVAAAFPSARYAEASGFAIQLAHLPPSRFRLELEWAGPDYRRAGLFLFTRPFRRREKHPGVRNFYTAWIASDSRNIASWICLVVR